MGATTCSREVAERLRWAREYVGLSVGQVCAMWAVREGGDLVERVRRARLTIQHLESEGCSSSDDADVSLAWLAETYQIDQGWLETGRAPRTVNPDMERQLARLEPHDAAEIRTLIERCGGKWAGGGRR